MAVPIWELAIVALELVVSIEVLLFALIWVKVGALSTSLASHLGTIVHTMVLILLVSVTVVLILIATVTRQRTGQLHAWEQANEDPMGARD